ncbi:ATP-binding protein [Lacinutrix sp. Hel_I_90]|uniref:sensor histidine kinase n=1 Tax=Lacinutrix sp. Hel_I_90 TaxID=1249999 RepID=UPI0006964CD2|nr:ATP-binding protein [Lacinutrix sp. Hel_I_90]
MKSSTLYDFFKKPLVAGFTTFIILILITQYITYQKYLINENEQKREINNRVDLIKEKLQALVMYSYSATKTLAYIVERNGIPTDFDAIAIELLDRYKYFDVVELVNGKGVITHVYPIEDNEVIGFNILTSKEASSGAIATIKRKDFFIAGPINLKQGGVAIVSRQPIFINDTFVGFSAVVTKLSTFFNDLNIDTSSDSQFMYQLSRVNDETGEEEFFLENDVSSFKTFAVPIEMSFGEWKLYVVPLQDTLNTAFWFGIFGCIIAILGSWGVWFLAGQSERFNTLMHTKLAKQESQLKFMYDNTRRQIERSESNLNQAQQIAKLGSWELDMKTNKLSWSKEMFRIFEKNPETFAVTRETFLDVVSPENRELVLKAYTESVINKTPYQIIYRLDLGNQKMKYVNEQCETFYDEYQNPIKSFGTIQDITERFNNEKELLVYKNDLEKLVAERTEELNESKEALLNLLEDLNSQSLALEKEKVKAQSADLMKSAFLATMSHELRTPMNSIIGFTGILLKELAGPLNEEQKKQIKMVKTSGEHLLGLINDVLDISKIEAGKLKVSFYPFNYLSSLERTIAFLLPQASAKGLKMTTEITEMAITLVSDERRVEQILLNLLSNAIKFSKEGIILIKVDVKNNVLITQVIDQGIGISKKDLVKLFMPFIQLQGGLSRAHEGTGLGLAICKNLVEKLGGTIHVDSQLGKGSNFTFKLPLDQPQKK